MRAKDKQATTIHARVRQAATKLLGDEPAGLRYSELHRALAVALPDIKPTSLPSALVAFTNDLPAEIQKPSHGLYVHCKHADALNHAGDSELSPPKPKVPETAFYGPFADWLMHDLEECTKAIALGGSTFGSKWGTPDVIGIREQRRGALIEFPTEIVSAEIKTAGSQLIVAFGQAVAYRLFSHKSYLVVPVDSPEPDVARLDVLARMLGIGLILFDAQSPEVPNFSIRVRAAKHEPDGYYLNDCLRHVEKELFG
ncbi:MAG: hypothetical protein IT454_20085 [Planctomycetes bacterium]|nr:hypothetical protein [Planctomycetota bacterium]